MSLAQTQITVPTANNTPLCGPRSSRRGLVFKNHDATNFVVIGGPSVTLTGAAGGVALKPGDIWVIADATGTLACEGFYAIASVGAVIVGVLEQIY
jgi:hypothetical protein